MHGSPRRWGWLLKLRKWGNGNESQMYFTLIGNWWIRDHEDRILTELSTLILTCTLWLAWVEQVAFFGLNCKIFPKIVTYTESKFVLRSIWISLQMVCNGFILCYRHVLRESKVMKAGTSIVLGNISTTGLVLTNA